MRRWPWPRRSRRWWMWFLSGVWKPAPRAVRRTKAKAMSTSGTPRMKNGMNSGAKKKKVTPASALAADPARRSPWSRRAISSPRNSAPASPMKMLGRVEVVGQEPEADPAGDHRDQRADVVCREQAQVHRAAGRRRPGRPRRWPRRPAARPSRPSIRLTALVRAMTQSAVMSGVMPGVRTMNPAEGHLELVHRHAEEVEDRRRQHLAGDLGRGRHLPEVVDQADDEDGRRRPAPPRAARTSRRRSARSAGIGGGHHHAPRRKPRNIAAPPP